MFDTATYVQIFNKFVKPNENIKETLKSHKT